VLGATRATIARGFLIEYGILATITAVIAAALGTLAAWLVVTQLSNGEWSFDAGRVILVVAASIATTLSITILLDAWSVLGVRAAAQLRNE
jgi:putative ABC transport system permease protein